MVDFDFVLRTILNFVLRASSIVQSLEFVYAASVVLFVRSEFLGMKFRLRHATILVFRLSLEFVCPALLQILVSLLCLIENRVLRIVCRVKE
jgi:hypothetical protein